MNKFGSALKVGIIATIVMEVFLRLTGLVFNHGVNFAWINGTSLGLNPQAFSTIIIGYLIFLFGGVVLAYLYLRFIPKKNVVTGILYAVVFVMMIVAGLIVMPITGAVHPLVKEGMIPNPGFFGLGFGPVAGIFTFLGHVVYGWVLGEMSKEK
jgi:hypothetical protein